MNPILLAIDGSEYAVEAAREAIDLAADRNAPLHVLCVVDRRRFDDPALSAAELATIYAGENAETAVNEVVAKATDRDVTATGEIIHGIPHEEILEYAGDVDAEVIVIGQHGDHSKHFAGVGRKVSKQADRQVLVVEPAR